jgi:hypothetical protein
MTLDALARKFHLKVTRDERNDKIIQGWRGHLYVDAGKLCAMWLDAHISMDKVKDLGTKVWVGDFTLDARRRRLRDAKVTGIPPENYLRALRLTGCRRGREMGGAQREALTQHHFKPKEPA